MNEEIIQEKLRSLQEDLLSKFDELKSDNQKFKLRLQKIEEKLGLEDPADKINDEVIEEVACEERDDETPDFGTKGAGEEVPEENPDDLEEEFEDEEGMNFLNSLRVVREGETEKEDEREDLPFTRHGTVGRRAACLVQSVPHTG